MTEMVTAGAATEAPAERAAFPCRVFGVGMNKTGTSSLRHAFLDLGVAPVTASKLIHRAHIVEALFERGDYEPAIRYARLYRGFEDRPWNVWEMYRHLDRRYEGSLFILTLRDEDSWWRSVERWITVSKPWVGRRYQEHLRVHSRRKQDMIDGYRRHNDAIREYFAGSDKLLELDLSAGEGWPELCGFLGLAIPERPFPHANRQRYDHRDRKKRVQLGPKSAATVTVGTARAPMLGFCVSCDHPLEASSKPRMIDRNWRARLPVWSKRMYRYLQRRAFVPSRSASVYERRFRALLERHPDLSIDDLAVVCCLFNPCGYASRVKNYQRFRDGIAASGVPLLTVELAFGSDPFCLPDGASNTIRLRTADVMWQKERLLNVGISELRRRGYRKIVWLDADVIFEDVLHWPWHVAAKLEDVSLCQAFGQVLVEQDHGHSTLPGISAVRYLELTGQLSNQNRRGPTRGLPFGLPLGHSGYGWAARTEVFERVELFDQAVIGGADKLMYAASCGRERNWEGRLRHLFRSTVPNCERCGHRNSAPDYKEAFDRWAEEWHAAVGGRVGWVDLTLRSFYHGDRRNRLYEARRDILLRHRFDPRLDLALDEAGCWQWASDKPGLRLEVQNYLFERMEDV